MPLLDLQRDLQNVANGQGGRAQLLEVEVIERVENEITQTDEILSMLLPN